MELKGMFPIQISFVFFFLKDPAPPEIYPLPLPDPLPTPHAGPADQRQLSRQVRRRRRLPDRHRGPAQAVGLTTATAPRRPAARGAATQRPWISMAFLHVCAAIAWMS